MTASWRDSAGEEVEFQLLSLLGSGLSDAEMLVEKHGEFYPFALLWPTGASEPEQLMVLEDPSKRRQDSAVMIERTLAVLRDRRSELDAFALVIDAYINGQSAISVAIEHRDGIHFARYRAYQRKRFGRGAKLGELGGYNAEPRVWGAGAT